MTTLLPAFIIGLAGSLHCIGMCSPLVMAVSGSGRNALFRNLQYNFGRIATYGLLGSIFGFAGQGLQLTGLQQGISITFGVGLIVIALTNVPIALPRVLQTPVAKFTLALKNIFARTVQTRSAAGIIALGMINGLLPCGLTLVALGYCVTLPSFTDGLLAMLFFGLGTLPGTAGFAAASKSLLVVFGVRFSKMKALLMITCAALLIVRGMPAGEKISHQTGASGTIVVCGPPAP